MTSARRMTPRRANAITILSTLLVCFIGGIIIGAIFFTPVISNLLGDIFSPMTITSIEPILSCFVIGSILGTVTGGIILWNREAIDGTTNPRDGYEDLEANRGPSIPSRLCLYQHNDSYDVYHAAAAAYENALNHGFNLPESSDSSESPASSYSPDIQAFRPHHHRQYALTEANLARHNRNTPRHKRPSSPASSVRPWHEHLWAPNVYVVALDLDDGSHEGDAETCPPLPPTPGDRAPLLQGIRRGPRYS
ncbi:hypothetical protein B0T09DRAFT_170543 [Sordaria sp. MPI-SDFR-AT-0083]|nr:hypothetical protein B0T09DRAFT_170543 [Sordaria sp. MPI-SDFR-AT-0083]